METFSALLAICAGNSPVHGEFPTQRPVTRSFDAVFDQRLNKRLSNQSWGWWFETLSCPLWRHCNEETISENYVFLHDRSWISPWIKSISNELDITSHVIASQLSGCCDVINNRLWRHQQNINPASEARVDVWSSSFLSSLLSPLCRVRNIIMYVLSWRTVSALTPEISTKMILSRALKQFGTRVHTLFFM